MHNDSDLNVIRYFSVLILLMAWVHAHAQIGVINGTPTPASEPRGTPVITVGNDPACDFEASSSNHGLAQAINAAAVDANGPGETLIRVANTGNYIGYRFAINVVSDQNLRIEGAYVNCGEITPTGARTLLSPSATQFGPIIRVGEVSSPQTLFLSGFEMRGGIGSNGGAIEVGNNNFVIAEDLLITGNEALSGGGVSLVDLDDGTATTVWFLGDTTITNNDASVFGGGIYCQGAEADVVIDTDVSISLNTAVFSGGGVSVRSGCEFTQYASFPDGVYSNQAGSGGGYAVSGGSLLTLIGGESGFLGFGDRTRRTTVDGNRANENGGGIFASGNATRVRLLDSVIRTNRADDDDDSVGDGGGIWIGSGAELIVDRTLDADECHDAVRCSEFRQNRAVEGGAIYASGANTDIDVRQTWFALNEATDAGSVAFSTLAAGELPPDSVRWNLEGNAFVQNALPGNGEALDFRFGNSVDLRYSTFAANADSEFDASISIGTSNVIGFTGNVVDEANGRVFNGVWSSPSLPNSGIASCSIAEDFGSLPPFVENILIEDPRLDSQFRPMINSSAVDFCSAAIATPAEPDLLNRPRGVDTLDIIDRLGPYDLGAFELQITSDQVFSDRFQIP